MNTRISSNNYKKCKKRNWDQSKDWFEIFEVDKGNANAKKNNGVTLDSDYNSDSM